LKFIDTHMHVGRLRVDHPPATPEDLIGKMDELGIERTVLLPIENPEELDYYVTTEMVLDVVALYPARFIPFCNVDPRHRYPGRFDPRSILEEYVRRGCKGFGENLAGIAVDDEMNQVLFAACGELGLPMVMHFDYHINRDGVGFPGLERMLQEYPETIFIGHGPHFWAEISADVSAENLSGYPKGPVVPTGTIDRLLSEYPNLYADLSAGSGNNALTRDPDFARDFLERHQAKLLFGTDFLQPGQEVPNADTLRNSGISEAAMAKIGRLNAMRLLKL